MRGQHRCFFDFNGHGNGLPLLHAYTGAHGAQASQVGAAKFLMCNNALGAWTLELAARGKGDAAAIGTELRAHLLPGVTVVPAMVVAIGQAQAAGIAYNRQ